VSIPIFAVLNYFIYNNILSKMLEVKVTKSIYQVLKFLLFVLLPNVIIFFVEHFMKMENLLDSLSIKLLLYFLFYILLIFMFKKSLVEFVFFTITEKNNKSQ